MTSRRNVGDDILDAARGCVEAFGVRRTKLVDIACRAGVSRPTVYRYWPDVDSIVADLLTRELHDLIEGALPSKACAHAREALIQQCATTVSGLIGHPLFRRIIDNEPELLATYAFQRLGVSQLAAIDVITRQVCAGHDDGSVRSADPAAQARTVFLVVQAAATSWRLTVDVMDTDELVAHVRALLDGYLKPSATPGE
ncbi:TetR/AcrR family transcriptional regulator [Streptomyces sp. 1222.5]|uniref:TetR/AcrR family transcriptional regulator n=1 Tax=Streptomyces sp. 1222.5 TaxID=1881026 RepID=UPI003EBF6104